MTKRSRRIAILAAALALGASAAGLAIVALGRSVAYFYAPSDLAALPSPPGGTIRLGGLVAAGSILHTDDTVRFTVGDGAAEIDVRYRGLLPDLFREGQGVVVEGRLAEDGALDASRVLAKHDESYMPREVAEALKEKGLWREGADPQTP